MRPRRLRDLEKRRIIACKIETGIIESRKKVIFTPSGGKGLAKEIEMFGNVLRRAEPGDSVGLIVDGVKEVKRGEVVSYPENPAKIVKSFPQLGRFIIEGKKGTAAAGIALSVSCLS